MNLSSYLSVLVIFLMCASCQYSSRASQDICHVDDGVHVCHVPFEAIYVHREKLINRLVRLDGYLVARYSSAPVGEVGGGLFLLFSSREHAESCVSDLAVELDMSATQVHGPMEEIDGWMVSVVGRLEASEDRSWASLKVLAPPSIIGAQRHVFSCLRNPSENRRLNQAKETEQKR